MISFARGVPAPECLPVDELADCARAVLERDGTTVLSYGPAGGYRPLREFVLNAADYSSHADVATALRRYLHRRNSDHQTCRIRLLESRSRVA